jgi:AcrR family transcriptional regulator
MDEKKGQRRRGAALEDAILAATWTELSEQGYANLTFESVAKRAGTSRTVLHRRWVGRAELVAAAIARYVRLNPLETPDLGNVRDELLFLLRRYSHWSPPRLVRLVFEMSEDLEKAHSNFSAIKSQIGLHRPPTEDILDRAVARGEIDPRRLTPRLAALPTDLARHEIMITLEPLSEAAILEIVDQIFLPLVAPDARAAATGR